MKHAISNFKQFVTFFILLCTILAYSTDLMGSHAMGADLTYTHLGGNDYRIKLSFYRDCEGISAPASPTLNISSMSCGQSTTLTLTQVSTQEVSMLCTSILPNSTCSGGTIQGTEEYIYEATYSFPANCQDWLITYSLCCRNAATTNLQNTQNFDMYIETKLDNVTVAENNSPYFVNLPLFYVCSGQQSIYTPGAVDLDGDSLAYSLVNPLDNATTPVTYIPPFSPTYPLSTSPPNNFLFDPQIGQMLFTPDGVQVTIVAVLVEEFRNGVKIGSIVRDMQIIVLANCANNSPDIIPPNNSNINGGTISGNTITTCAGQTLTFPILASDIDLNDTLFVTSNINLLPGASLNVVGINPVTIDFSWPTIGANSGNYHLSIGVSDNGCPVRYDQSIGLIISVPGVKASANQTYICQDTTTNIQLDASVVGMSLGGTWAWSPPIGLSNPQIPNPIAAVSFPITYTVTYTVGGCTAIDTIHFDYGGELTVSPVADTICKGASVQLNAFYQAVDPTGVPCATYNPGCPGTPSTFSIGADTTSTGPGLTSNEAGSPFLNYFHDGRWQAVYKASELHAAGISEGLITELAFNVSIKGSTIPYNNFSIKLGCTVNSLGSVNNFLGNTTLVYTNSVNTTLGWNNFVFSDAYYWNGTDDLLIEICFDNNTFSYYDHVYYSATADTSVIYKRQDFNSGCTLSGITHSNRRPNITFKGCVIPLFNTVYSWTPPTGLDDPNISDPVASPSTTTTYTVTVQDGNCTYSELVTITVFDGVEATVSSVNPACGMSDGSITVAVTTGTAPFTYTWSDPLIGNTGTATGLPEGTYSVTITDTEGCTATASSVLTSTLSTAPTGLVISNPAACTGDTVSLMAVGGSPGPGATLVYFDGSCGGTVITDPTTVVVSGSGQYFVRYEDSCGVTACATAGTSCFNFEIEVSALFEGPYQPTSAAMRDDLRVGGLLPFSEPYSAIGYQHIGGGNESTVASVFSVSGANAIIDWVFVELRSVSDYTTAVATRSALLQADGDIVDMDGVTGVDFEGLVPAGNYWVVIRHKSHVDVMSDAPIYVGGATSSQYDFTTLGAFGNGLKTLANGVQVLYDGDINQDGKVDSADRSALWNARNQSGYLIEDTTLNGYCGADDRSQAWNNKNIESQIP